LICCAQTGSGKTAAFMFVIISKLLALIGPERTAKVTDSVGAMPLALIITPTRELAIQIKVEAEKFTYEMPLRPVVAYGGQPRGGQIRELQAGCDILIATPGRLGDFIESATVTLQEVQIVTLDEADRLLDMGFQDQIKDFLEGCPDPHQTLMFSATFEEELQDTARDCMQEPAFVHVGRVGSTTDLITQQLINVVDHEKKDKLMELIIEYETAKRILVFVERKSTAIDLDRYLDGNGIYATSIHGDRDQIARETALNNFARGQYFLMVATDVAARGLDVDGIDVVINFDMPKNLDSYVHRIGRTGRCGRRGLAISFINSSTKRDLLNEIKTQLEETKQEEPDFLKELIEAQNRDAGPCFAFRDGECDRGDDCPFLHVEGGGDDRPCFGWQRGMCENGEDCQFSHEGEAGSGGGRKAGVCYQWEQGTCSRGEDCKFAHEGESGAKAGQKQECRQYSRGQCTRGDTCNYEHVGDVPQDADAGGGGGFGGSDDFPAAADNFGDTGGFDDAAEAGGW